MSEKSLSISYLAGPYSSCSKKEHEINLGRLYTYYYLLTSEDHGPIICPPLMTAGFDNSPRTKDIDYIFYCLRLLSSCDRVVVVPDFSASEGTKKEMEYAEQNNITVELLPKLTERDISELKSELTFLSNYNLAALYGLDYLRSL